MIEFYSRRKMQRKSWNGRMSKLETDSSNSSLNFKLSLTENVKHPLENKLLLNDKHFK